MYTYDQNKTKPKTKLAFPPRMAVAVRSAVLLLAIGCGGAAGLLTPVRLPRIYSRLSLHRVAQPPLACAAPLPSPPPPSDDPAVATAPTAEDEAVPIRGPRPELSPLEVVEAQLALFKSAEEEDLEHCWSFFSPYGPTYDVSKNWRGSQCGARA
jgi:hypothetical protein